ncbi:MAG: plasmid replication/partition related protein [Aquabacterium sp.]
MSITVSEELKAYIDPLTPEEHEALERSLLAEGCRDALVLWGNLLIDGHNRYGICQKHGIPFQTVQHPHFKTMDDVHLWMIDQHLGRRSVSDFQRGVLALRKREILAQRQAAAAASSSPDPAHASAAEAAPAVESMAITTTPLKSRADIARAARLSANQVVLIEKIQTQAVPELVDAVKQGTISINAAAAVASLPAEEQKAAAIAGKDELKQAAKRVREVKRKAKPPVEAVTADEPTSAALGPTDELQALRQRVAELTAENEHLRAQLALLRATA